MSFRIFATGSKGFRRESDKNMDMDDFKAVDVIASYEAPEKNAVLRWANKTLDKSSSTLADAYRSGVEKIAGIEAAHLLKNAVSILATCEGAANGLISIGAKQSRALRSDVFNLQDFKLSDSDDPGVDFFKRIAHLLEQTKLNNFGVLLAMSIVLSQFKTHIGDSGTPRIVIQLTKKTLF
jgi:hypothetical protein